MPVERKIDENIEFMTMMAVARLDKRLTQTALAKLIGSTKNTIWCWEHGIRRPNMSNLKKLEKTLGVKFK